MYWRNFIKWLTNRDLCCNVNVYGIVILVGIGYPILLNCWNNHYIPKQTSESEANTLVEANAFWIYWFYVNFFRFCFPMRVKYSKLKLKNGNFCDVNYMLLLCLLFVFFFSIYFPFIRIATLHFIYRLKVLK